MSRNNEIIKAVKLCSKKEGKILFLIRNVNKNDSLKSIRDKDKQITTEYQFYDGNDLIDINIEDKYQLNDLINEEFKIFVDKIQENSKNEENSDSKKNESMDNIVKSAENVNKLYDKKKKIEKLIDENKSFTYLEEEIKLRPINFNNFYQYCITCNQICCQECIWPSNALFSQCKHFSDSDKKCSKCPGRCSLYNHIRTNIIYEKYVVKEKKIFQRNKELFDKSSKDLIEIEKEINKELENISNYEKYIKKK